MASANPDDEDYDPSLVNTGQVYTQYAPGGPSFSNPGLTTGPGGAAVDQYTAAGKTPTGEQLYTGPDGKTYKFTSQLGYIPYLGAPTPPPPGATDTKQPPPPSTGPQTVGPTLPPGGIGSLLTKFDEKPPAYVNPGDAASGLPPGPAFPTLPAWADPTGEEAANFPGYKFAFDQGNQAAANSAAARGVTNTGGTLKDIADYGRNAATQNYSNVRNQMKDTFMTNVQSQYLAPYQAAFDKWSNVLPASQTAASNLNTFNWNNYLKDYDIYRNQKLDTFDMFNKVADRGATVQ